MDPLAQTYVPFTFTNITNTNIAAPSFKSRLIDQKIKQAALQRQLQRPRPSELKELEPSQIVKDFGESLLGGRLAGLGEQNQRNLVWRVAPKERMLRKVNCAYFRGKKAVFKSSNVRISFEITDKL